MTERLETVESNIGLLDGPTVSTVDLDETEKVDHASALKPQIGTRKAKISTSTYNPPPEAIESIETVKAKKPTATFNEPPNAIQRIELIRRPSSKP